MKPVIPTERMTERFMAKVAKDPETGCWNWTGFKDSKGYGRFQYANREARVAHQISYGIFVGHMPDELQLDHLCRNTSCVNPEHLEPVTPRENQRRRTGLKTHCPQGHEYTPENSYYNPGGTRFCRICRTASRRADKEKKKRERAERGLMKPGPAERSHCQRGHDMSVYRYVSPGGIKACRKCKAMRAKGLI